MHRRPETTLFLLMSVDGKISTGAGDDRDFDKDLPTIPGVAEGLSQYYKLEQKTDTFSLNSGKSMAKVGWNQPKASIDRIPVSFIVVDNKPHLTELGVKNLLQRTERLYIVTTHESHPALDVHDEQLEVISYSGRIDFPNLFNKLGDAGVTSLTIQSGGELNATLLRAGLVDKFSIIVAPLAVGGRATPTLIDGESVTNKEDLLKLRPLRLLEAKKLENSYLQLIYEVIN